MSVVNATLNNEVLGFLGNGCLENSSRETTLITSVAMFSAMLMIAHHIAGKATRDALFLTAFDVSRLPMIMMVSSAVSIAAVLLMSRLLNRFGPARLIPFLFGLSAVLLALQWMIADAQPKLTAVLLYIQISALNSIIISGFWSVINERFDPYEAKKVIGKLTAATTFGGLIGGVSASTLAAIADTNAILLMLSVIHVLCAGAVHYIGQGQQGILDNDSAPPGMIKPLKENPLIRKMAILALLVATTAAVLDFILKYEASRTLSDEQLITFFSWFYTAVGFATFLVQSAMGNKAQRWLGLGGAMAVWPMTIILTGFGTLLFRSLITATLMRASANLFYNSFFRAGFELLYTPISAEDKRTGKILIDVGADRSGDMLGGFLVMGILLIPFATETIQLIAAMLLASVCMMLIFALHRGYVHQLADNLRSGRQNAEDIKITDPTTAKTVAVTQTAIQRDTLLREIEKNSIDRAFGEDLDTPQPVEGLDPVTEAIFYLRSGDESLIRRTLASRPVTADLMPHVAALLANDNLLKDVIRALRPGASNSAGQISDILLDPANNPLVRRRLPLVLASSHSPLAVVGLTEALEDRDWNVRFRSAQALEKIMLSNPALQTDETRLLRIAEKEVGKLVAEQMSLEPGSSGHKPSDDDPDNRQFRFLFHLFGILYGPDTLRLSYDALMSNDRRLQGTAMEFLENQIPAPIWQQLQPALSGYPASGKKKSSLQQSAKALKKAAASLLPATGTESTEGILTKDQINSFNGENTCGETKK